VGVPNITYRHQVVWCSKCQAFTIGNRE